MGFGPNSSFNETMEATVKHYSPWTDVKRSAWGGPMTVLDTTHVFHETDLGHEVNKLYMKKLDYEGGVFADRKEYDEYSREWEASVKDSLGGNADPWISFNAIARSYDREFHRDMKWIDENQDNKYKHSSQFHGLNDVSVQEFGYMLARQHALLKDAVGHSDRANPKYAQSYFSAAARKKYIENLKNSRAENPIYDENHHYQHLKVSEVPSYAAALDGAKNGYEYIGSTAKEFDYYQDRFETHRAIEWADKAGLIDRDGMYMYNNKTNKLFYINDQTADWIREQAKDPDVRFFHHTKDGTSRFDNGRMVHGGINHSFDVGPDKLDDYLIGKDTQEDKKRKRESEEYLSDVHYLEEDYQDQYNEEVRRREGLSNYDESAWQRYENKKQKSVSSNKGVFDLRDVDPDFTATSDTMTLFETIAEPLKPANGNQSKHEMPDVTPHNERPTHPMNPGQHGEQRRDTNTGEPPNTWSDRVHGNVHTHEAGDANEQDGAGEGADTYLNHDVNNPVHHDPSSMSGDAYSQAVKRFSKNAYANSSVRSAQGASFARFVEMSDLNGSLAEHARDMLAN
jgi:hypothetical protein